MQDKKSLSSMMKDLNYLHLLCVEIWLCICVIWPTHAGIILCMCQANERWRYNVTPSLNGWAHTQNDPCTCFKKKSTSFILECSCFKLLPGSELGPASKMPLLNLSLLHIHSGKGLTYAMVYFLNEQLLIRVNKNCHIEARWFIGISYLSTVKSLI